MVARARVLTGNRGVNQLFRFSQATNGMNALVLADNAVRFHRAANLLVNALLEFCGNGGQFRLRFNRQFRQARIAESRMRAKSRPAHAASFLLESGLEFACFIMISKPSRDGVTETFIPRL
jgi:hypothetical protein